MHRLLLFALGFAALAVLTSGRAAQATDQNAHAHGGMGGDRTAQAELGAQAAFDARGVLWAAHKVSGHIAVSRSDDRGRSWSNPVLVTAAPEPTDTGGDARPKIALGPGGEIYVTWTRPLSKPYTGEIRFTRSLDGGRTFSPSAIVHRDRQEITHRFDSIVVNGKGQVIVAWIDKRDLVAAAAAAKAPAYRGAAVYFAVSDDRGATFRGDYKLADHSCECCRIALVRHDDGSVTAMWRHIFEPNIRDHAVAQLFPDGRAGPMRRVSFENWRIDACPHHGPSLVEDAQHRLHAVWFSAAPQQQGVHYARLRDGGTEAHRRVGGEAAAHADLAVLGPRVVIAWKEFDGERTRLRALRSNDGGESWQEHELAATAGSSDQPRVLTFGGDFHVFWNTRERPLSMSILPP